VNVRRDAKAEKGLQLLVGFLNLSHIDPDKIRVVRTTSNSRAYARIWGVNRILQEALNPKAIYVIELVDDLFEKLNCEEKIATITHELAHIPRTFSGYLRPHNRYFKKDLLAMTRRLRKLPRLEKQVICEYFTYRSAKSTKGQRSEGK